MCVREGGGGGEGGRSGWGGVPSVRVGVLSVRGVWNHTL